MTPQRYVDPHLNLFAAYGPHRLWENNVTAAIGKALHYGGPAVRRSFLRSVAGVRPPTGDVIVCLQRRPPGDPGRARSRFAFLLEPETRLDSDAFVDSRTRLQRRPDEPRPDLWLVDARGEFALHVEVKLWSGVGGAQVHHSARRFRARLLEPKSFAVIHAWLSRLRWPNRALAGAPEALVDYLEDLGLAGAPGGFKREHLAVSDGRFVEPGLIRPRVEALVARVAAACQGQVRGVDPPRYNGEQSDFYTELPPRERRYLGYGALGLHPDSVSGGPRFQPTVFLSGARRSLGLDRIGRSGFDQLRRRSEKAIAAGRQSGLETALHLLPVGGELILKSYDQRRQAIDSWALPWRWIKRSDKTFNEAHSRGPGAEPRQTRTRVSPRAVVEAALQRAMAIHGRPVPKKNRVYRYVQILLGRPEIPYSAEWQDESKLASRLSREVRELTKLLSAASSPLPQPRLTRSGTARTRKQ